MSTRNVPPPQNSVATERQYSDTKGPLSSDRKGFQVSENRSRSVDFKGYRRIIRYK